VNITRRQVVLGLGATALCSPLALFAQLQKVEKIRRIGLLVTTTRFPATAFRQSLRKLGYVEGRNLAIEFRGDTDFSRLPALASELVAQNVEVIVSQGSTAIRAAQNATSTIPIVFAGTGDPVAGGFVKTLAKPGGNLTGLSMMTTETSVKNLEFLRELVPRVTRVGLLGNRDSTTHDAILDQVRTAAKRFNIAIISMDANSPAEVERGFVTAMGQGVSGVILASAAFTFWQGSLIAQLALKNRIATISPFVNFVDFGGLISHGPDLADMWRRSANYVDKILKGARPADLPVEQPTQMELVINMKTAKALGITIPQSVLLRASRTIE
jgi:putative ABC transport system substrate-binding protein